MQTRLVAALVALLLFAGTALGLLWALDSRAQYKSQAEALETRAQALEARLGRIQGQVQAAQAKAAKAAMDLKEALNANPEWRDTAVPGAVSDGLCQHLRCK